jgi:signal transduction histidine kinase
MELDYLNSNAAAISQAAAAMLDEDVPDPVREAQLLSYAFLSQTQVRLYDADHQIIAETGMADTHQLLITSGSGERGNFIFSERAFPASGSAPSQSFILLEGPKFRQTGIAREEAVTVRQNSIYTTIQQAPSSNEYTVTSFVPAVATVYGFQLGGSDADAAQPRSKKAVTTPITGSDGSVIGYVELSGGPAYGQEIVNSILRGWVIAGILAVLLAVIVGVILSQRISAPVRALTAATEQMYAGDLSARVAYQSNDELGKLSQTFNAMSAQLESTFETLRRFVLDAAHELQTPLTALRTNLELAADEQAAEKRTEYVAQSQQLVERLSRLTGDLLDLSRLESGRWNEPFEPVDLTALVCEVSEPYAARAEQAGQELILEIEPGEAVLSGSSQKLRSALRNLLDNALKFTPAGGTIRVRLVEEDNGLRLTVSDSGIGIPADEVEMLFNRFHRARNAAAYPGSGIGLAIVRAVVEAHGGSVAAENNAEGGACFTLCLPEDFTTEAQRAQRRD